MRTEAKEKKTIKVSTQQAYHGGDYSSEAYASADFEGGFRVFNSDRTIQPGPAVKCFGTEIEMTSRTINSTTALCTIIAHAVYPAFPKGLFKQQHDGSLGGASSTELITQPMTKAFVRNHYNDFRAMYDFLKAIGTGPDDSCGMHINISMACFGKDRAAQEAAIMRLHNFMCDNYDMACALFKRSRERTRYCGPMRRDYLDRSGSHFCMANYSHMDAGDAARVEIRLVGPQKSFAAFRNTFEVVFWLVDAAKDGRDFSNMVKLFKGCNECVLDRLTDLYREGYITMADYNAIEAAAVDKGIRAATR